MSGTAASMGLNNSAVSTAQLISATNKSNNIVSIPTPIMTSAHINSSSPYVASVAGSINSRSKPRPLELSINSQIGCGRYVDHHISIGDHCASEEIPIYEILDLMEHINRAVRANEFSAYLGSQILRLVVYLKKYGLTLESSYQNELNRVFVSLRQACCRDAGHLGTVCRMEMMELIELRAMGWKPNLSHSRYYMKRSCGSIAAPELNTTDYPKANEVDQFPTAPESAPPFGTVTINPFAFNLTNNTQIASTADINSLHSTPGMTGATPYFLIPASPITHNQASIAFLSPTTNVLAQPVNAGPLAKAVYQTQSVSPQQSPSSLVNSTCSQKATPKIASKSSRSAKTALKTICRAEIMIRNADSGKVMGVKGRRVAVIEEMSNTIVSFQKVTPNCKDRMITINGPSEAAIENAKKLIEETIRRNVSPDRIKNGNGRSGSLACVNLSTSVYEAEDSKAKGVNDAESEVEIVTGENGEMLKLISPNPKLLQKAYKALDFYFKSQRSTVPSEVKSNSSDHNNALKINRRKSLSSLADASYSRTLKQPFVVKKSTLSESDREYSDGALRMMKQKRCAQSTPNLANKGTDSLGDESESNESYREESVILDEKKCESISAGKEIEGRSEADPLVYSRDQFVDVALKASAGDLEMKDANETSEILLQQPLDLLKVLQLLEPKSN